MGAEKEEEEPLTTEHLYNAATHCNSYNEWNLMKMLFLFKSVEYLQLFAWKIHHVDIVMTIRMIFALFFV